MGILGAVVFAPRPPLREERHRHTEPRAAEGSGQPAAPTAPVLSSVGPLSLFLGGPQSAPRGRPDTIRQNAERASETVSAERTQTPPPRQATPVPKAQRGGGALVRPRGDTLGAGPLRAGTELASGIRPGPRGGCPHPAEPSNFR